MPLSHAQGSGPGQAVWTTVKRLNHKVRLWGSGTSENTGILRSAETWLHDRPHCSVRGEGPRPCTEQNARAQPSPRTPTERGGPPPLVGLSPGLCGPGGSVDIVTDRTVSPDHRHRRGPHPDGWHGDPPLPRGRPRGHPRPHRCHGDADNCLHLRPLRGDQPAPAPPRPISSSSRDGRTTGRACITTGRGTTRPQSQLAAAI